MIPIVLAFLILAAFLGMDSRLRSGPAARSLEHSASDRSSTTLIGAAVGASTLALVAAVALDALQVGRMPLGQVTGWLGVGVMLAGLGMRTWAVRILGDYYTRTLRTTTRQTIVSKGPYSVVRHPGYLGSLLLWAGAGLATANWIATGLIALLMLAVYTLRIRSEEKMLADVLGDEYRSYCARTWKLVPFIY